MSEMSAPSQIPLKSGSAGGSVTVSGGTGAGLSSQVKSSQSSAWTTALWDGSHLHLFAFKLNPDQ